jgi:hypothetical protein
MGIFKDCGCGCDGAVQAKKFKISILAALLFFVVANPSTYIVVRRLLGARIATPNGNPTTLGLGVHTVVFMLITWGMMNIKKEGFEPAPAPAPTPAEDEEDEEDEDDDEEVELEEEDEEEAPAPAEDDDDEEAPAPAEDDEDDESDDVKKAKKKIDDAWLYHAVDTGLRFGTFDVSSETAGPAARKKSAMICACPDGTKVTVSK